MKKIVNTNQAPKPIGPYSQAVSSNGMLYLSGQIAIDPATNELITSDVEAETHQAMKNIMAILKSENLSSNSVVKTTIFLKDMNDFSAVNQVYGSYFTDSFPARETVEVSGLPKGVRVEISLIAAYSQEQ